MRASATSTNVRRAAGMFDVSHMGEDESSGPEAEAFLQRILSNDVTKIAERGAQYRSQRDDGGVLDDLFTYRLGPSASRPSPTPITRRTSHGSRGHAYGFEVVVRDGLGLGDAGRAGADGARRTRPGDRGRAATGCAAPT